LARERGWREYARWHLGLDEEQAERAAHELHEKMEARVKV
jgi:hypothetical protein